MPGVPPKVLVRPLFLNQHVGHKNLILFVQILNLFNDEQKADSDRLIPLVDGARVGIVVASEVTVEPAIGANRHETSMRMQRRPQGHCDEEEEEEVVVSRRAAGIHWSEAHC